MDNAVISRAEHEEFKKRLEEENRRINRRLELLEDNINEVRTITVSVEKLAVNMENMLKEQVSYVISHPELCRTYWKPETVTNGDQQSRRRQRQLYQRRQDIS